MAAGKKRSKKAIPFDASRYLDNPDVIAAYISEALKTNDPGFIASAIGDVAKARGMSDIAAKSGLGRESLYKALGGDRKPELETILKVLAALGIGLSAEARKQPVDAT
jgi:probable addiction module antidote protein